MASVGLEPTTRLRDQILNLARMPISPRGRLPLCLYATEFRSQSNGGDRNRTYSGFRQRVYSPSQLSNFGAPPYFNHNIILSNIFPLVLREKDSNLQSLFVCNNE